MSRELYVDASECTGCEYCVAELSTAFKMVNGISIPTDINGISEQKIQLVIDNCPAECICWK